MRKSGDPYFIHPVSVADIITELQLDTASVCAGLLHDVVEDTLATEATSSAVRQGGRVPRRRRHQARQDQLHSKEDRQAENFRKMLVAMARDIRVLLVKLCDRLDNMRTLEHMKPEAQERIARETLEIYAPLANRLGIQWFKSELEDLSFRTSSPSRTPTSVKQTKHVARDRDKYITDVCAALAKHADRARLRRRASPGAPSTSTRSGARCASSSASSSRSTTSSRSACSSRASADCYAALGVIHSQWTPVPGRFKDYIALPKPNMYQSLHTTVIGPGHQRIEIQIRTHEMHRVAEHGIAAHWKYKENTRRPRRQGRRAVRLAAPADGVPEGAQGPGRVPREREGRPLPGRGLRLHAQGRRARLPARRDARSTSRTRSTREVGEHCSGARVNGAIVSAALQAAQRRHRRDHDQRRTSSRARTGSTSWPRARARSRIRALSCAPRSASSSIKLGRELLEREMHKRDLVVNRAAQERASSRRSSSSFRVRHARRALLGRSATASSSAQQVVEALAPAGRHARARSRCKPEPASSAPSARSRASDGTHGIRHRRHRRRARALRQVLQSRCPATPIIGFITRGRGVTVHRRGCRAAIELDPERRIESAGPTTRKIDRPVQLRVVTADRPGILATCRVSSTKTA